MALSDIPPEFRKKLRWIPHPPYHKRWGRRLVEVLGRWGGRFEFKGDDKVSARWVHHGEKGCKIYTPVNRKSDAAMLWIHGGGYILLEAWMDDGVCRRMAEELGITIVSAEYRHAPEHPFPAALDDCRASWHWLLDHADELGVNPQRSIIAGESAGGGLTAALAQRLYDEGGIQPLAQVLVCPMLDDRTALREDLNAIKFPIWNNLNNRGGWTSYLGQEPGATDVPPYAVPARRESLAGLPPAWLAIGTADVFLDESREYAARLNADGVPCELIEGIGGIHSYQTLVPDAPISVEFWNSLFAFIRRILKEE